MLSLGGGGAHADRYDCSFKKGFLGSHYGWTGQTDKLPRALSIDTTNWFVDGKRLWWQQDTLHLELLPNQELIVTKHGNPNSNNGHQLFL